jgi:hypothetical protein
MPHDLDTGSERGPACAGAAAAVGPAAKQRARLPQTREGEAGLCVDRLEFAGDGRAVEFCRPWLRDDIHDFVAELNAGKGSVGGSSRPHDNQLRQR